MLIICLCRYCPHLRTGGLFRAGIALGIGWWWLAVATPAQAAPVQISNNVLTLSLPSSQTHVVTHAQLLTPSLAISTTRKSILSQTVHCPTFPVTSTSSLSQSLTHVVPDFNADAHTDLLWYDTVTGDYHLSFLEGTTFISTTRLSHAISRTWQVAGVQDFDNDAHTDILWRNSQNGRNVLWLMQGATRKPCGVRLLHETRDMAWKLVGIADFDRNGTPDVLWRNTTANNGRNVLWLFHGPGRQPISPLGVAMLPQLDNIAWQMAGIGDFNGDGHQDLLWHNREPWDGRTVLWLFDHTNRKLPPQGIQMLPPVTANDWHVVAVADFDGDSRDDIFWRNTTTGGNALWLVDTPHGTTTLALPPVADTDWTVLGGFDSNQDGTADLLWYHRTSGRLRFWQMKPDTGTVRAIQPVQLSVGEAWEPAGILSYAAREAQFPSLRLPPEDQKKRLLVLNSFRQIHVSVQSARMYTLP